MREKKKGVSIYNVKLKGFPTQDNFLSSYLLLHPIRKIREIRERNPCAYIDNQLECRCLHPIVDIILT